MRIALIGDFNPAVTAHRAIDEALRLAGAEGVWIHTTMVRELDSFDAIWCAPASPYASMEGALGAIRYAREQHIPFLGSCGGFQHAVIEYARNVRGLNGAAHAETDPEASLQLITPLQCTLVEKCEDLVLMENTLVRDAYGTANIREEYHCSYGLNPAFESTVIDGDLRVTARDLQGAVRAVELSSHPFFVATLFQSERRALGGEIPPLVKALLSKSATKCASSGTRV
jgi:CTP synthase (UTP-ammonia lyase)